MLPGSIKAALREQIAYTTFLECDTYVNVRFGPKALAGNPSYGLKDIQVKSSLHIQPALHAGL